MNIQSSLCFSFGPLLVRAYSRMQPYLSLQLESNILARITFNYMVCERTFIHVAEDVYEINGQLRIRPF